MNNPSFQPAFFDYMLQIEQTLRAQGLASSEDAEVYIGDITFYTCEGDLLPVRLTSDSSGSGELVVEVQA